MTISYLRPSFLLTDNQLSPLAPGPNHHHAICAISLSDQQAAEAVRIHIDWKYALNLEREPIPVLISSSCANLAPAWWLGMLSSCSLRRCSTSSKPTGCVIRAWAPTHLKTHVLAAIRTLNRLECVGETMRHAREALAIVAPTWLLEQVRSEWKERYEQRIQEYRLPESQS